MPRFLSPVLALPAILAWASIPAASAPPPPQDLLAYAGDQSVILHWDRSPDPTVSGYSVYGAAGNPTRFSRLADRLPRPGFAHLTAANGQPMFYRVRAVNTAGDESVDSLTATAEPRGFAHDDAFLDYLQRAGFDYFWREANPTNGLVRDRSTATSHCSIAAVGFGLSAITVGIDHGWITREAGRNRVLTTLRTFWNRPQGEGRAGTIGYRGWFYHFLDMQTADRAWSCELSSIDTVLFLAGALHAREYFDQPDGDEATLRSLATALFERVDWTWMRNGEPTLSMGWKPESGFLPNRWLGYNEAMVLYLLGLGAPANPLPASSWTEWTRSYRWETHFGQAYVPFPPLFGHQYSHVWIDFQGIADAYMRDKASTYFENSRRATLAQRAYCIANPARHPGYGAHVWGLTACDGPASASLAGYAARGAPPPHDDDGTLAPTAVAGSLPFAPEICLPTLRYFYDQYRTQLWTAYGFRDAFNLRVNWWDPDVLGIDQGPIVLMIENHRTRRVWDRFMRAPEIQRGLKRAGFAPVAAPGNR